MKPDISTPAKRLASLKAEHGANWREYVKYNLATNSLGQGFNGEGMHREPIWYADRRYFKRQKMAHDILSLDHTGWYGDTENQDKLTCGIVACLPHGRFIAGYRMDDIDNVYYGHIFDNEKEAARMADEHARVAAEREDEYSQRWNEAQRLENLIEAKKANVCELRQKLQMAIAACHGASRDTVVWFRAMATRAKCLAEVHEIINDIRAFKVERKALNVD